MSCYLSFFYQRTVDGFLEYGTLEPLTFFTGNIVESLRFLHHIIRPLSTTEPIIFKGT